MTRCLCSGLICELRDRRVEELLQFEADAAFQSQRDIGPPLKKGLPTFVSQLR